MAGNLGSLIVHLGADTASLQSDLGRANAMFQASAEGMRKQAESLGKAAGVAFAAAATAVSALVKHQIDAADEISKLSQKVGISTESLSGLKLAAGLAGVEVAGLQTRLVKFNQAATEAAGGSKQQAEVFKALGISLRDANGNLKPTEELLGKVADKFAGYRDSAAKTTIAVALFGKAGADMIPLLNGGAKGFADAADEAKAYGLIVGSDAAEASGQFNDNLSRLKLSAQGFGNQLAQRLVPSLASFTDELANGAKQGDAYGQASDNIVTGLKFVVKAAVIAKGAIEGLTNIVAAAIDTLLGFGEITSGVLANVSHAAAAGLLAAGGQFAEAQAQIDLAGKSLGDGWEAGSKRIKTAWSSAYAGVETAINDADRLAASLDKPAESAHTSINGVGQFANVLAGMGRAANEAAPIINMLAGSQDNSAKAALAAAEAQRKFHDQVVSLAADLEGPLAQAQEKYREALTNAAQAVIDGKASQDDFLVYQQLLAEQLARTTDELAAQGNVVGQLADEYGAKFEQVGMDKRQKAIADAIADATKKWDANTKAKIKNAQTLPQVQVAAEVLGAVLFDSEQHAAALNDIISEFGQKNGFDQLIDKIKLAGDELAIVGDKSNAAFDPKRAEELRRSLDGMNKTVGKTNLSLAQDGVASLQKYAKEGTAAYKVLGIAQDVLAYKSAITAIATQGGGDPYTAFARIAAMIALMASIGITIGGGGGSSKPSAQSAEARQAVQGTGSILGDSTAKSESIAKATEITANATTTLIGINRGMLTALQSLQKALGAAGNQLARGAGNATFPGLQDNSINLAGPGSSDPVGGFLGSFLFGGSQEVIDKGIVIAGGKLSDMLDKIAVGAYQTIEEDGGLFGSDSTFDSVVDVSDSFGKQFQLVIGSIVDTVKAGAIALGLLPADVEKALAAYKVEEIRISLEGLSADDQQKALEAVFSKIFDGIAGSVVPFIGQFQKVGEGLGETLVRIATEVQVAQEGFKQLGLSVSQTDPEKFAQIADGLIEASGGIDKFISGMQAFVQAFAPDSQQFKVAFDAITSAFDQVGLTLPDTRDGLFALMQSLDATTASGQAQIATLLRLTDAAITYYDALDKVAKNQSDYATFIAGLNKEGDGLSTVSPFAATRLSIEKWEQDSIKQANALAKAAGLQGAAEQDLVLIHKIAARRISDAIAELMKASLDLVDKLYGGGASATADASASINSFGDAMTRVSQSAIDAVNLLLGALSPLNDQQKLETARSGLMAGTVSQDAFLEIARRLFASSQKYNDEFRFAQQYPGSGAGGDAGGNAADAKAAVQTPDEIARQRRADANTLAQNIASLSLAQDKTYQQVANDIKLNLGSLAKDLGVSNEDLTTYLNQLKAQENAVPDTIKDGTDRIVKAIYDVAGIVPPTDGLAAPTSNDRLNSYAAAASTDEPSAALQGLLAGVNARLDSILQATIDGSGEVVGAVNETAVATRGIGDVIDRGNRDMTATIPRNTRPYNP